MKKKFTTIFAMTAFAAFSIQMVAIASQEDVLDKADVDVLKQIVERDQEAVTSFRDLISQLEMDADLSSNAGRRNTITDLQAAMIVELLVMEDRVGENHLIRQHGKDTPDRADRVKASTYPGEARVFKKTYQSGGTSYKPALNRLTRMQATYGVCNRMREEAIGKHPRALPAYMERVQEFARLMDAEIAATRALIPPDTDKPTAADDKYQERKSRFED